ncbi:MAG: hypothetical protein IKW01_00555 [Firmicutes bacterium]|nr:hypothetical protein [Bacillota bacterium]
MGVIYRATCPSCEYTSDFHLGGGLSSINLPFLLKVLSEADRAAVEKMNEEGRISSVMGTNELVKACDCGVGNNAAGQPPLTAKMILAVTDKEGSTHLFGHKCADCGKELIRYPDITKPVPCPVCGNSHLEFRTIGHWD